MNEVSRAPQANLAALGGSIRPASLTEQMQSRKAQLEADLAEVNALLEKLEKNPETQEILDGISKLGGLRY